MTNSNQNGSNHAPNPDRGSPTDRDSTESMVALYLSGGLDEVELAAFEKRLDSPQDMARDVLREYESTLEAMMDRIDPANLPSPELRERLLAQVADELTDQDHTDKSASDSKQQHQWAKWQNEAANDGLYTLRSNEGDWLPTDIAGIEVRNLYVDKKSNRMTAMFRMAPGTSYIPHVHDDYEECYVLQGDLHVGDLVMKPGDYQRAEPGSLHGPQRTEGGCVLLITSSMTDEHVD